MQDTRSMILNLFDTLEGTWSGLGKGKFPTIDSFDYKEISVFKKDEERLLLHIEQRTWVLASSGQRPRTSHWESGFLFFNEDLNGTYNSVQSGGRFEILKVDTIKETDHYFELSFSAQSIMNDTRMISSSRKWQISKAHFNINYEMSMATSKVKDMQLHLTASLKKEN